MNPGRHNVDDLLARLEEPMPARRIAVWGDSVTARALEGTAAAVTAAVMAGAHMIRVHDVEAMRRTASVAAAIRSEGVGWIS